MNTSSPIERWVIRYGADSAHWPLWTRWRYRRLIRHRPELANELSRLIREEAALRRALFAGPMPADLAWLASIPERHAQDAPDADWRIRRFLPPRYAAGAITAAVSLVLGIYLGLSGVGAGRSQVDADPFLSPDELLTIELLKEGGA